jgi:hypothetical protein
VLHAPPHRRSTESLVLCERSPWTFLPHVRQRTSGRTPEEQSHDRSEGKPITRGDTAMAKFFRSADAAEVYSLEHRFPFAATLIGVFMAGNVGSAVLMLLAQA